MPKEMLINVSAGEECRIALVEDGKLEELYLERTSAASHVGNVYAGRVMNVEASIQAAFIDFGTGRNGFLHISDLMPTYFGRRGEKIVETVGRKMARRDRPPIQQCLRRGDEIMVQIIKEGIGTKGPTLSSYVSIPGRILVMMPGVQKTGVSRKIEDETERRRLRKILDELEPPKDVGFIIRTAGVGKTKAEIERDFKYLTRLWEDISRKREKSDGPTELYAEGDLVIRTVRDTYTADVEKIAVDDKETAKRIKDFFKLLMPRTRNKVEVYDDPVPLFHRYRIENDIEQMHSRTVPLPSGGYLIIDSTEAVVAIDVNSGKFREHADAETTAFKTDLEAADEIARQLRLRDLGGVVICDFIDLRYERHRRELEQRLAENLKKDRAKTRFLRMSEFGIIEMTRQRMRPSLKRTVFTDCPGCKGHGLVKTPESVALDVMRQLAIAANDLKVRRVELSLEPTTAFYVLNRKRAELAALEAQTQKRLVIKVDDKLALDELHFDLFDDREGQVYLETLGMEPPTQPHHHGRRGDLRRGRDRERDRNRDRRNERRRDDRETVAEEIDSVGEEVDSVAEEDGSADGATAPKREPREPDPDAESSGREEDGVYVGDAPRLSEFNRDADRRYDRRDRGRRRDGPREGRREGRRDRDRRDDRPREYSNDPGVEVDEPPTDDELDSASGQAGAEQSRAAEADGVNVEPPYDDHAADADDDESEARTRARPADRGSADHPERRRDRSGTAARDTRDSRDGRDDRQAGSDDRGYDEGGGRRRRRRRRRRGRGRADGESADGQRDSGQTAGGQAYVDDDGEPTGNAYGPPARPQPQADLAPYDDPETDIPAPGNELVPPSRPQPQGRGKRGRRGGQRVHSSSSPQRGDFRSAQRPQRQPPPPAPVISPARGDEPARIGQPIRSPIAGPIKTDVPPSGSSDRHQLRDDAPPPDLRSFLKSTGTDDAGIGHHDDDDLDD